MNEKLKKEIDTAFGLISTLLVKGDAVDAVAAAKAALRRAYALLSDSEETATKEEIISVLGRRFEDPVTPLNKVKYKLFHTLNPVFTETGMYHPEIFSFDDKYLVGYFACEKYYADVLAKLGAETASSSDEIAAGLEKFSSVAETVGLSYEYATSALTTITATTRQSADVVGTALKTLFSRIQDLELGKTLEDGTTIGTYSEALEKVGINIKNQNGELKKMDDILDEMGAK